MSDLPPLPQARIVPRRARSIQFIWLVPVVALLIGGWLGIRAILQRGPIVTITFQSGEGLEAGKTRIKYKDVDIGGVRAVALSDDRRRVVVTAQFVKQAESLLVDDTRFWVVRPRVSGGQVSGLATLLTGSHIGMDAGKSDDSRRDFVGLETAPVVTVDAPGRSFNLRSPDLGSLDVGTPVYFRRIQVGQVMGFEIEKDGGGVSVKAFVTSPYDRYVTTNARFWHASGFDVSIDTGGFKVDSQSILSMLIGGIAFESPPGEGPGGPAPPDALFTLHTDRVVAMKPPDREVALYRLVFADSLRGLAPGAQVDFRGFVLGEVRSISSEYDQRSKRFRFPVTIALYPDRLKSRVMNGKPAPGDADLPTLLQGMVERGFRAQLRPVSLITNQLYIALDYFPGAAKAALEATDPIELPTVPSSLEELQVTLAGIAKKLEQVPFAEIGADVRRTLRTLDQTLQNTQKLVSRVDTEIAPETRTMLQSLDRTLKNAEKLVQRLDSEIAPEAKAALVDTRRTLGAAERAITSAERTLNNAEKTLRDDAPLQQELRESLREISRAAQALRSLADYLDRHPESLLRGRKDGQ